MTNSILNSTKKVLGIEESYTAFDVDIMMHINSTFSTLNQLGLGPEDGFSISDDEVEWDDFLGSNPKINSVKTYMYLKLRLVFDPPPTSFAITAMESQIQELEWRLNVEREGVSWVDPDPAPEPEPEA